jgi:hypothetical protein
MNELSEFLQNQYTALFGTPSGTSVAFELLVSGNAGVLLRKTSEISLSKKMFFVLLL